jgi:hypothetical protein
MRTSAACGSSERKQERNAKKVKKKQKETERKG